MRKKQQYNAGLTLIEMLVVLGIFATVSGILLFNYGDFRNNVSIRNLSQEVALAVRKAQTYATSVRGTSIGGSTRDYPAYGIAFASTAAVPDLAPDQKEIVLFVDVPPGADPELNGDTYYSYGSATCGAVSEGEECFEKLQIATTDKIKKVEVCTSSFTCSEVPEVYISFQRPNPDAVFCVPSGAVCDSTVYSSAILTLESAVGLQKKVSVWNTGQISVQ
ncbi:MAG TPA: type II secretion system protein [Candidatus Paceibacterota bacterium]|nr:type II secretion system protein [Candidatus Paceibacterota bacterium]